MQDRHGKVIWPENWRACDRCNAADYDGKPMPRPVSHQRQVLDAMTAYQMVHITEGVVQRGTATGLRDLNRPMFGKTGTNNGPTDVWFVGGTPQFVGGLYIGYDTPRSLGGYAQGGTIAVPIFHQFAEKAYEGLENCPSAPRPAFAWCGSTGRADGRSMAPSRPATIQARRHLGGVQAGERAAPPRPPCRRRSPVTPTGPAKPAAPARQRFLAKEGGIY